MRPLIAVAGLGSETTTSAPGSRAVHRAGGLAAIVPPGADSAATARDWIARADGLLLTGDHGGSGKEHIAELIRLAIAEGRPVLGVAGGMQALNAALGGEGDHEAASPARLRLAPGSVAEALIEGDPLESAAGSIAVLGTGLSPSGWSEDGAVRVIEHTRSWALGVPWFPEEPTMPENMDSVFTEFVRQAASYQTPDQRPAPIPLTACRTSESAVDTDTARLVELLVDRVLRRLHDIGEHLVDRYVADVVDYRALGEKTLRDDVLPTAERNVEDLLAAVRVGSSIDEQRLEGVRRSARRRASQGISLRDLLHAYRLWGRVVWDEILTSAGCDVAAERDAVLWIAGRVMIYVDRVSSAVAQAYLDEVTGVGVDDGTLRGDLLESLISGESISSRVRRQASSAHLDSRTKHAVLVVRPGESGQVRREQLRHALVGLRTALRPHAGVLLLGVREDEVVAIYPMAADERASETVRAEAESWAESTPGFVVGIGYGHAGHEGVAASYAEAQEAVHTVEAVDEVSHVVHFSRVLVDHVLRTSAYSDTVVEEAITPLRGYDHARGTELVRTLRAYFEHGFNLARSAAALHVTPNTVVYRLGRIRELTGRDATDPDDLLVLVLGIKLHSADPTAS